MFGNEIIVLDYYSLVSYDRAEVELLGSLPNCPTATPRLVYKQDVNLLSLVKITILSMSTILISTNLFPIFVLIPFFSVLAA